MKINNQTTVNRQQVEAQQAQQANAYINYQGECLVKPIMFNPTQEDLDKLGAAGVKLFDDHYTRTTQEDQKYSVLSLLFEFNPSELLGDDSFPTSKFGRYDIAISNDDLVKHMSGNSKATGEPYEFWEVQLIDARFNTLKITLNEDPKGKNVSWIRQQALAAVERKNSYKVAELRYDGHFYNDLSREERADMANNVDLQDVSKAEAKRMLKFNANTAVIQKQGYYPYTQLLLNMSALNISYFNPLTQDVLFDAKAWLKLVNGDVTALNKSYTKDAMYRYSDASGKPTAVQPKLGVFLYTKLKANGYYNQEVLSPSYPGFNSSWDATFNELTPSRQAKGNYLRPLGDVKIKTRMDLYNLRSKLLGFSYDGTVDDTRSIVKYPYSFEFDIFNQPTEASQTNASQEIAPSSTSFDDSYDNNDDIPF